MSKTILGILASAVALIVAATWFGASFIAGGGGVVLVVALIYSYVVTKRDVERRLHSETAN